MLYTASYYVPEDWHGQAYRVSRGHPRGRKTQWETLPFLYPTRGLLKAYQSGAMDFTGLETEYRGELAVSRREVPESASRATSTAATTCRHTMIRCWASSSSGVPIEPVPSHDREWRSMSWS